MTENVWYDRYWALRRWVEKHHESFVPNTNITEEEIELFWSTLDVDLYDQK